MNAPVAAQMIRKLTPADLDSVVDVHRRAFRGYPNVLLGKSYMQTMLAWFIAEPRGVALGAFDGSGRANGYVVGAAVDQIDRLSQDLKSAQLRSLLVRPWLAFHPRIAATIWSRLRDRYGGAPAYRHPQITNPCMDLFSIAVAAEASGRGIGKQLMTEFEVESRRLQMRSMYLAVFPSNVPARRIYDGSGWTPLPIPPRPGDAMHYVKPLDCGA